MGFSDWGRSRILANAYLRERTQIRYDRVQRDMAGRFSNSKHATKLTGESEISFPSHTNHLWYIPHCDFHWDSTVLSWAQFVDWKGLSKTQTVGKNFIHSRVEINGGNTYHQLFQMDYDYFEAGRYDDARGKLVSALQLFPQGKAAIIGLSKTLGFQCQVKHAFCEEASAYQMALTTVEQ